MAFLFGKYFRTPSHNSFGNKVFRVFSSQAAKTFFTDFFLDFWANVSELFKQDFLLIIWSKKTIFGFETLGDDGKSIFNKLYSPCNKPSIFRKWLILWRKSWAAFLSFVAEIKLSIFSWLVKNFSSHVSLLAGQVSIFRKLFL